MATRRSEGESEPLTLGQALAAHVRLIVWCKSCNHRAEPDVATQFAQHGARKTRYSLGASVALYRMRGAGCRISVSVG
jgi:hypothetical protein